MRQYIEKELKRLFFAGVEAVQGEVAVERALPCRTDPPFDAVLAIGKAAASMYLGSLTRLRADHRALIITKHGHAADTRLASLPVEIIESSHPVPCRASLDAGRQAAEFVRQCAADTSLLVLISGGASALAEYLTDGTELDDLKSITSDLLANGADIATINTKRKSLSRLKAGRLLAAFRGKNVLSLAISDVAGDDIAVIGSGIGDCAEPTVPFRCEIMASNALARSAVADQAAQRGHDIIVNEETLYGDVNTVADRLHLICSAGPDGIYLFGGEPTVHLPPNPGEGGRNQALALLLAERIRGRNDLTFLVAGTDGTDGPTEAAGAIVDGASFDRHPGAQAALARANAGYFLRQTGDVFVTGPTGTNVMDLAIVIKTTQPGVWYA